MKQVLQDLSKDFHKFIKNNSYELVELEQANFINSCEKVIKLENIVNNIVSSKLLKLYKSVVFADFNFYVERIQRSHFSFIDKKNMMLLLMATRGEKYANTLAEELSEYERKFLNAYLLKTRDFVEYCRNEENSKELALFLYDINAFRKYLKHDEFLMPIKLSNAFNWVKKDIDDYKKYLEKTKKALFESRRRYYDKTNLHDKTIKEYKKYEKQLNELINSI